MHELQERKLPERGIHVIIGMFLDVQNSDLQMYANSETSVQTNTQLNLLMTRELQRLLQFSFHRMMNDRCNCETFFSRMTRPQHRVRLHHLASKYVLNGEKVGPTLGWSHSDRISKSAKSKRSNGRGKIYRMDFEHGRKARTSAGF